MRLLLLCLFAAASASAQTRPDIRQTKAPTTPPVSVVVFQQGRAVVASLGPGIVLDTSGPVAVLRAEVPQASELRLQKQGSGWPLGRSCARLAVFRNGIRQLAGEDYTVVSGALVFRAGTDTTDPSSADDIVVAECWQ